MWDIFIRIPGLHRNDRDYIRKPKNNLPNYTGPSADNPDLYIIWDDEGIDYVDKEQVDIGLKEGYLRETGYHWEYRGEGVSKVFRYTYC